jgi:hypothetical protein
VEARADAGQSGEDRSAAGRTQGSCTLQSRIGAIAGPLDTRDGPATSVVPVEDDVAGNVVEKLRRTGAARILSLGYCWQRLVLDIDRFSGIPRSGQSFGYDQRDWLTDVPHLAERKHGTRRDTLPERN